MVNLKMTTETNTKYEEKKENKLAVFIKLTPTNRGRINVYCKRQHIKPTVAVRSLALQMLDIKEAEEAAKC